MTRSPYLYPQIKHNAWIAVAVFSPLLLKTAGCTHSDFTNFLWSPHPCTYPHRLEQSLCICITFDRL